MIIKNIKKQEGGALLVAMIMIFMLSIMGISSMKGSALERRMATNSVQSAASFQAAESLTDLVLNDPANLENAWEAQPTKYLVPDYDLKNTFPASQAADALYLGNSTPLGYSQGVNTSAAFSALNYEIRGATLIHDTRTASAVTQGAYRVAPGL